MSNPRSNSSRSIILGLIASLSAASSAGAADLRTAASAFLRSHADSPVHWQPWGDEAFAAAAKENKPIYLAIGAFTSELSRAMRQQSFARPEIADALNQNFVCVLVDRDEHPEVAALYQTYVHVVKQAQGWPINVWLTPDLKPFDGATYMPPSDEWGKEGFANGLKRVVTAWQSNAAAQRQAADEAVASVAAAAAGAPPAIDPSALGEILDTGETGWSSTFDAAHGGFGDPPKYPEPELLRFLLRGGEKPREIAAKTLHAIVNGAVHDPLDGGFFRYASDAEWKLPYFQKTLVDQARLALALLDSIKSADDPQFRDAARGALNYALTLGAPAQGFANAEDATPAEILPSFLWTDAEIRQSLRDRADEFAAAYGVTAAGNLAADAITGIETAGKNILYRTSPPAAAELETRLGQSAAKLLEIRRTRPLPLRDSAASSGAHGLLLAALARAGAELPDARFTTAAREVYAYIRDHLRTTGGTLHNIAGQSVPATPQDYAFVIEGLATYAEAAQEPAARELAVALLTEAQARLWDKTGGRFFAYADAKSPGLWARVSAPAPDAGGPPAAETAMLITLVTHNLGDDVTKSALAAAIAADVNDASTPARGDQLLALRTFATSR